ncbi:MAG: hypothetical protein CMJ06_01340 [Pelagibacterales bacterium]|nr:hypothetical protein [Pelagibacterales bacterium]OUU63310.1 MAG: hypothetical protein CBC22_01310 [Alphaproteobacteria bacterium TMED62]|tara:strand:+ start:3560 stop:4561 length:1002 start_codon:yes stop_codon:yes gene_type:complete
MVFFIILKIKYLSFFMIAFVFKFYIVTFFFTFIVINYSIAENSDILLNEILPGVLVYNGQNEEQNQTNQGAIANKVAIIGSEAILVYDTGPSKKFAENFIKQVQKYSENPIKYLVVSHRHFDHAYGIEAYIQNKTIIYMDKTEYFYFKKEGPLINKLLIKNFGFNENNIDFSNISEKNINFINDKLEVNLGNRKVLIENIGIAHTKGDLIVYDFNTKTYIMGDLLFQGRAAAFSDSDIPLWINVLKNKLVLPWNFLIPGHGIAIKNDSALEDTKNWLYFIDKSLKRAISQGDMISEIFQYPIPKEVEHLKMKSLTLRQGIKKQLNLYKKKYIE